MLNGAAGIEVVGKACDGVEAVEMAARLARQPGLRPSAQN